jgi:hypothetical protein
MLVASWASAATAMRFLPMAHIALLPSPEEVGVPADAAVGEEALELPLCEFMRRASCGAWVHTGAGRDTAVGIHQQGPDGDRNASKGCSNVVYVTDCKAHLVQHKDRWHAVRGVTDRRTPSTATAVTCPHQVARKLRAAIGAPAHADADVPRPMLVGRLPATSVEPFRRSAPGLKALLTARVKPSRASCHPQGWPTHAELRALVARLSRS